MKTKQKKNNNVAVVIPARRIGIFQNKSVCSYAIYFVINTIIPKFSDVVIPVKK